MTLSNTTTIQAINNMWIRTLLTLPAIGFICILGSVATAAEIQTRVVWVEDKPQAEVSIANLTPGERTELEIPLELFDAQNKSLWKTALKVPLIGNAPYTARVPLEKIEDATKQHRLEAVLRNAALEIDYRQLVYFADAAQQVQTFGFCTQGVYPNRKVEFVLGLNGFKGEDFRELPVTYTLRDSDDNVIQDNIAPVMPSAKPALHLINITPDVTAGIGPYTADINIESEGYGISFHTDFKFSQASALVPVSSLEQNEANRWFAADAQLNFQSLQMYYSPQFTALTPFNYPKISYDTNEKHAGRQSLRIDYQAQKPAVAWGWQDLPAKPTVLSLWVKGNGTADELIVHFEDRVNFTLPAWQRNANFSQEVVCKLDSSEWKRFRVPVLGDGQLVAGFKGSTVDVDGPVRILGFSIRPAGGKDAPAAGQPLSVWIDDLAVETQAQPSERLSLELTTNVADGLLTSQTELLVSVGNGFDKPLEKGRVNLVARDNEGQTVYDAKLELAVKAGTFGQVTFPLAELTKRNPRGPVEVDVTFLDSTQAGARLTKRYTFKSPHQGGLFHDFEEPWTFSSYAPGKVGPPLSKIIEGGASATGEPDAVGHALSISVKPGEANNSVLLHPALPGIVDRVELMLYGDGRIMEVQPWFIDSGFTGIWLREQNVFWTEPIRVDWQGWRKVTIVAPPTPAHHGDKNFYFLYKPWYPLNLALNARVLPPEVKPADAKAAEGQPAANAQPPATGEQVVKVEPPAEIRIDNVRVITHLPAAEELRLETEYSSESRIHAPGTPLRVVIWNYAGTATPCELKWELHNYQGFVAQQGTLKLSLPAGAKQKQELVASLTPGIYELRVSGVGEKPITSPIIVLKAEDYFGPTPLEKLVDTVQLRQLLGQMTENIYLDWDNTEGAPYMFHYSWFYEELKTRQKLTNNLPQIAAETKALDDATAQVTKADEEVKKVAAPVGTLEQQLGQIVAKLAQSQAMLPPAQELVKTTTETYNVAKTKLDDALKLVEAAKKKVEDTKAAVVKAETDMKAAEKTLADAQKAEADAKTAVDEADKAVKAADELAKKAAEAAAASAKAAEEAKKASDDQTDNADLKKAAEDAQVKADADAKAAGDAKKVLEDAQAVLKTKQELLVTATAAAVAAKDALDKAVLVVKTAKEAADVAGKELPVAEKVAADARTALAGPEKAKNEAQGKLDGLTKQIEGEQAAILQKTTERDTAKAVLAATEKVLADARAVQRAAETAHQVKLAQFGFKFLPVVGFSADWAGPEATESIRGGSYSRYIPNLLQVPRNASDWSLFVREMMREYHGRFDNWVFWENPDIDDAPQNISPERYSSLLTAFQRWVKLYQPEAKVVAGGFNFTKMLDYLDKIDEPAKLPFDEIAVQMNLGELAPEHADVEGFLDELNEKLQIRETNRLVRIQELDWGIADYLSPAQQAAYHARAALILDSRGATPHQFNLINTGFEFAGYGVFYRVAFGNTPTLQSHLPYHVPKPAYFALIETRKFLESWDFVTSVQLADRSLQDNRAYIYRNAQQELTAVLWRAVDGTREYGLPTSWQGAAARDVFGFPITLEKTVRLAPLPTLIKLPAGYALEALKHDLRTLAASDGSYPVLADLYLAEPDSLARHSYTSTGQTTTAVHAGTLPGGSKLRETFVSGLESEAFHFQVGTAGDVLLRRRWYFDGTGNELEIRLNDGPALPWKLTAGQGNEPGIRESTFVLRQCRAGDNTLKIAYKTPGNSAGYRLEPLTTDHVPLVRWGAINARQSVGEFLNHASAVGTPLRIGPQVFEQGLGAHATSFIEYPLAGQFDTFEVTVGVDGSTEGRGSVIFRIFVDGKERANSKLVTGFNKPLTLKVDKLTGAERMVLSVMDAGDGDKSDLANWVDGKLYLKKK